MTEEQPALFAGPVPLEPPAPVTAGSRKRARDAAAIALGAHPLNGLPLLAFPAGMRCGDCLHRYLKRLAGTYPKCDLGPVTSGPATDVRASWPACNRFEAKQ